MTGDQIFRIAILGGLWGLYVAFKPQIDKFLHRLGYRDWRKK